MVSWTFALVLQLYVLQSYDRRNRNCFCRRIAPEKLRLSRIIVSTECNTFGCFTRKRNHSCRIDGGDRTRVVCDYRYNIHCACVCVCVRVCTYNAGKARITHTHTSRPPKRSENNSHGHVTRVLCVQITSRRALFVHTSASSGSASGFVCVSCQSEMKIDPIEYALSLASPPSVRVTTIYIYIYVVPDDDADDNNNNITSVNNAVVHAPYG